MNEMLYEEGSITPLKVLYKINYSFDGFEKNIFLKVPNQIGILQIDKFRPWDYFDGACDGNVGSCVARGVLYFFKDHYFSFSYGLEYDTNNMVDVKEMHMLVEIVMEKGI
jgi:hypothetical protein